MIDGGKKITLDGGNAVQILRFDSPNFRVNSTGLTLQHIALVNGKPTPTRRSPRRPAPCSQGFNDGEGGALYMRDGNLTVIDSIFMNNQAAPLGPDTGGGAIYMLGSKNGVLIVGSTFIGNSASNAGAVGCLFSELDVYDSLFQDNMAIGHDANNNDADQVLLHQQWPERGRLWRQRRRHLQRWCLGQCLPVCGDPRSSTTRAGNKAFGGGLFFTSNDLGPPRRSHHRHDDDGQHRWPLDAGASGSVTNVGTRRRHQRQEHHRYEFHAPGRPLRPLILIT